MKRFTVPHVHFDVEVEIFDEPLMLLEQFFNNQKQGISLAKKMEKGQDFVMLPLYSYTKAKGKYVAEKSGLNQFNAGGRRRNPLEVYIPIPKDVHNHYPNFSRKEMNHFTIIAKWRAFICKNMPRWRKSPHVESKFSIRTVDSP